MKFYLNTSNVNVNLTIARSTEAGFREFKYI